MSFYQLDNLILDIRSEGNHTEYFIVTQKDNKDFAVEFVRYSATQYQISKNIVSLTPAMLAYVIGTDLPHYDKTIDHWTKEFCDFIINTMNYVSRTEHIFPCFYNTVWNDGFEVVSQASYNILTNEVFNIDCCHIDRDDKGNKLSTLITHYIIYSPDFNHRFKLELQYFPDGSLHAIQSFK